MSDYQIGVTSPERMQRMWAATLQVERMRDRRPQETVVNLPVPLYFRNDSGHEIPPYGCCQVLDTAEIGNQNYLLAGRPIAWTGAVVGPFFFNGPRAVPDGDYGNFQPGPIYRAIGDGTTLAVNTRVGPVDASFDVGKGCLYSVLGPDDLVDECIRLVDNTTSMLAVAGSGIPANGSGTVTSKIPTAGDWTTGGTTYTARNPSSTAIPSSALVICFPVDAKWVAVEIC
jgi:hypothetical protein